MTRSTERERVRLLRAALATTATGETVRVSIGDDAAVLAAVGGELVWSIDAAVEGVHFRRDLMSLEDAGYRATMAALSDLGAMGAEPLGVLAALTLPSELDDAELLEIARGQRAAAEACATAVVGGNLSRGDLLTITTTVLGRAERPALRSGARPGDVVAVSGPCGLSGAGFFAAMDPGPSSNAQLAAALAAFRRPRARLAEGRAAVAHGATAMIDVSDGLASDVRQVAEASGVTIELDATRLVEPELERAAAALGRSALALALEGGEDYALVATFPSDRALPDGFRAIGRCVPQAAPEGGGGWDARLLLVGADGARTPVTTGGFDHFDR